MLTFWGARRRFCDRINRRDFPHIGALGLGGLTLPDILRLRAQAGVSSRPRAVILVCLAGGPSHLDLYDLEPGAPADYRGEFRPIKSKVPGFDLCEHMPRCRAPGWTTGGVCWGASTPSAAKWTPGARARTWTRTPPGRSTSAPRRGRARPSTSKVSQNGRDHWPDTGFALFAGAVRTGQVIGETDSRGERPKTRAVGAQNILGAVYHALGIDWRQKLLDFAGRPTQGLDDGEPFSELVS